MGSLLIEGERISKVILSTNFASEAEYISYIETIDNCNTVDATGQHIIPGCTDETVIPRVAEQHIVAVVCPDGVVAVAAPEQGLQEKDVAVITDIILTQSDYEMEDIRIVEVQ